MMLAALWWARRTAMRYLARPGRLAIVMGLLVGVLWVMSAPVAAAPEAELAALGGASLALWATLRIFGTVMLVPLIEEMFFRGFTCAKGGGLMPLPPMLLPTLSLPLSPFGGATGR